MPLIPCPLPWDLFFTQQKEVISSFLPGPWTRNSQPAPGPWAWMTWTFALHPFSVFVCSLSPSQEHPHHQLLSAGVILPTHSHPRGFELAGLCLKEVPASSDPCSHTPFRGPPDRAVSRNHHIPIMLPCFLYSTCHPPQYSTIPKLMIWFLHWNVSSQRQGRCLACLLCRRLWKSGGAQRVLVFNCTTYWNVCPFSLPQRRKSCGILA